MTDESFAELAGRIFGPCTDGQSPPIITDEARAGWNQMHGDYSVMTDPVYLAGWWKDMDADLARDRSVQVAEQASAQAHTDLTEHA